MASMKRGSDDESNSPPSKITKREDSFADDDGSKTRTGRIRKKSAKVLEMEEFEEIEKKTFSKKTDAKSKTPSVVLSAPGSLKKIKLKAPEEELVTPMGNVIQAEVMPPASIFQQDTGVAQEPMAVSLTPVKAPTKQAISAKVREGQGSVIKLLLSSPALPTTPSVSTNVAKTSSPVTVTVGSASPCVVPAMSVKKAAVKVKTEPVSVIKQEPSYAIALGDQSLPIKTEALDPQAIQQLLAEDISTSPPHSVIKSEPKTPKSSTSSLKMKLMMTPKDSQSLDSVVPTSLPMSSLFFGRDETDGTGVPAEDAGISTGKKKPPSKKKKTPAVGEKLTKQASKSPSAAEQMPNLAALVSGPKTKKGVKEETNLSMSDHIDTSMSDASLDMSSIVDSALDMEEEAALVIAEGTAATTSKPKKKRSNTGSKKKAKAMAAELHGFDSDDGATAPPDGDLATLAAKVQRSSGVTGGKKKSSKKLQEQAAQRANLQNKKSKRPPRRAPTAYMLYCNSQRPKVVAESPGIDFAQISRTLGVMWQCLSKKEKMMWRRKSKKLAGKGSTLISTGKGNKKESAGSANVVGPAMNQPSMKTPATSKASKSSPAASATSATGDDLPQSPVKGFGIEPIDIAAHLKLLGESLSIIGMRLQEHKGLIAVQGSLSVLLDSLLCACGPLMALTQQVPGLDGCSESTHARTLDSVAYIMPGL